MYWPTLDHAMKQKCPNDTDCSPSCAPFCHVLAVANALVSVLLFHTDFDAAFWHRSYQKQAGCARQAKKKNKKKKTKKKKWKWRRNKKNFTSFGQLTRLITCANHGNACHMCIDIECHDGDYHVHSCFRTRCRIHNDWLLHSHWNLISDSL